MSPAADAGPGLTRSRIENWDITHLEAAATRWRASADEFEQLFSRHRQNISGTDWEGTAKDTALDRVTADTAVVDHQGEVVRAAADLADSSVADLRAAVQKTLSAIAEAEADGFRVAEDLSVTDGRRYDITTIRDRNREINIEFATLPGHVDGEGSTIHFRFYESGGEVHLGIRGYIAHGPGTDEGWVGAPIRAGYGEVAKVTWQPYIDRLAANIAAAEGAVPVLTKGP